MASGMERSSRSILFVALVALCVAALDRLTKIAVCAMMTPGSSIEILPKIFHITFIQNTGSAFGLLREGRLFFIAASIGAIVFILWYAWTRKTGPGTLSLAIGLILGGAFGNLIDRVRFGYVVDFLDFRVWPVFNIADSAITVGAAILIWKVLSQNLKVKSQNCNSKTQN